MNTRLESFSHTRRSDGAVDHDQTQDRLGFRNSDGNSILTGIQEFTSAGDDAFARNKPGQLRYSNGVSVAELIGNSFPDFERKLLGTSVLIADNSLL
jgi:hypothetical protein